MNGSNLLNLLRMNSSNVLDLLSMLGSLALVILILASAWFGTRWYVRRMGQMGGGGKYIKVLDRIGIGAGTSLMVVQVDGQYYLLGVSDKNVRLISALPEFSQNLEEEPPSMSAPFSRMFREFIDSTRKGNSKDDGDQQ